MRSQRFGVRNSQGAHSSEWMVMWKTNTSDVYLATRTLGGMMKVSLHASGRCHIRAADREHWKGPGKPPEFLDAWQINIASPFEYPFAVIFPEQELREGDWEKHRDKGTMWIQAMPGKAIEVALFLVRVTEDISTALEAAGWRILLVDALLPDARRLLVAAAHANPPEEKLAEIDRLKHSAQIVISQLAEPVANPRILLLTSATQHGTRKFVETAVTP